MMLITTAQHISDLATPLIAWDTVLLAHSRCQCLYLLFQVVPKHKHTVQPGVDLLPVRKDRVCRPSPTAPMPVHDGNCKGRWLCPGSSIRVHISLRLSNHTSRILGSIQDSTDIRPVERRRYSPWFPIPEWILPPQNIQHLYPHTLEIEQAHILLSCVWHQGGIWCFRTSREGPSATNIGEPIGKFVPGDGLQVGHQESFCHPWHADENKSASGWVIFQFSIFRHRFSSSNLEPCRACFAL